jgi:polynucleotide 5'-hydroxyl-kinase GRC3/NOL9
MLGDSDTGKSTLGRFLYGRMCAAGIQTAYMDLDPGQNELGPPTTISLAIPTGADTTFPPGGRRWHYFVGNNSPRGHLLRLLSGLHCLNRLAWSQDRHSLLVNTSGFIGAEGGGHAIKWAKVELLQPCVVVALQRRGELGLVLEPLRQWPGVTLYQLPSAAAVRRRTLEERRQLRVQKYRHYFQHARRIPVDYGRLAVFPKPDFIPGQLVALEDEHGLTTALGLVEDVTPGTHLVWLRSPWSEEHPIVALRLGSLSLHLETYQESSLRRRI